MSTEKGTLRELYLDITGGEMLTESQEESPSHDPISGSETELQRTVIDAIRHEGLSDAVADSEKSD